MMSNFYDLHAGKARQENLGTGMNQDPRWRFEEQLHERRSVRTKVVLALASALMTFSILLLIN